METICSQSVFLLSLTGTSLEKLCLATLEHFSGLAVTCLDEDIGGSCFYVRSVRRCDVCSLPRERLNP